MARLTRETSKLFAANATEVGQFGSLNAGTKVETTDIATIQALPAWEDGWKAATIGDNCYPTLQERNGLDKVQSYMTNYLYQEGVAEWDAGTTYYTGSIVKLINGTNITLYQSLVDNNTAALSDTNSWKEWGYANSDLSNLSATGQKVIDGKWVKKNSTLAENISVPTESNYVTLDLTSYLPSDGYNYEVFITGYVRTEGAVKQYCHITITTDLLDKTFICQAYTSTASYQVRAAGTAFVPVGIQRYIRVVSDDLNGATNTGSMVIRAKGYRRIGTNG